MGGTGGGGAVICSTIWRFPVRYAPTVPAPAPAAAPMAAPLPPPAAPPITAPAPAVPPMIRRFRVPSELALMVTSPVWIGYRPAHDWTLLRRSRTSAGR